MRATVHSGRKGKGGEVYLAKHNDRNFDYENSVAHPEMTKYNYTYCIESGKAFEEAEKRYYSNHFGKALEEKNARYRSQSHCEKVKTMDKYYKNPRSCPEEVIYQIGNRDESIDPAKLIELVKEQLKWQQEKYPQCVILDAAGHFDEDTPHFHVRQVWVGHDEAGNETVCQAQALREMGVDRPNLSEKENRYNNAKITFTNDCREHFQGLVREYGIEIETEPLEASQRSLSITEYKVQQEQARLSEAQEKMREVQEQLNQMVHSYNQLLKENKKLEKDNETLKKTLAEIEQDHLGATIAAAKNQVKADLYDKLMDRYPELHQEIKSNEHLQSKGIEHTLW